MATCVRWTRYLLLAVLGLASPIAARAADKPIRPNIVLLFADDLGYNDLSCYGSEIPTPHIDSLAAAGRKLTSFYVTSSICTPSRFGLLTGRYPHRSQDGLLEALATDGKLDLDRGIRPHETTVATLLQRSGYQTDIIGKWHLGYGSVEFLPTRHGFDRWYGHVGGCTDYFKFRYGNLPDWYRNEKLIDDSGYATDRLADEAVQRIETYDPARPFFLYVPFNAPHYGKGWDDANREFLNIMQPKPADLSRVEHIDDELRRDYAAMVVSLDDAVGRILAALAARQLEASTLVIFTSDNGGDPNFGGANRPLRGDKGQVFEGGVRIPCLMRWSGRIAAGEVSDGVSSTLDFLPTFCHLAGVDTSALALDGVNLSAWLTAGEAPPADRRFVWSARNGHALRQGNWKYLRLLGGDELLFDIVADPYEQRDQAAAEPARLKQLRAQFEQLMASFPR